MSAEFDLWYLGAPYLDTGGSGEFDLWYLDSPFIDVGDATPEPEPPGPGVPWPVTLPVPLVNPRMVFAGRGERTLMESGRIRLRRLYLNPFETMDVEWNFTDDQFEVFQDFFNNDLQNGSLNMRVEIFGVDKEMAFADSTYNVTRSDNLHNVSATLEFIESSLDLSPTPVVSNIAYGTSPLGDPHVLLTFSATVTSIFPTSPEFVLYGSNYPDGSNAVEITTFAITATAAPTTQTITIPSPLPAYSHFYVTQRSADGESVFIRVIPLADPTII